VNLKTASGATPRPDAPQELAVGEAPGLARARALSRSRQLGIVGWVALAVVVLVALVALLPRLFRPREAAAEAPAPPGFFRPSETQWESLTVAPVKDQRFRAAVVAEGRIATNDDRSTPVVSPFSGHVSRIFAHEGDSVAKGAPLFAIDAQEFVQAQNDLITASAGLVTARRQLELAQTNEERAEALYEAKGAALKDLQQSRVDLATARGVFQTAEIALAAVRNRLRIFGKNEAEIDTMTQSEPGSAFSPEAVVTAPIAGTVTQRQIGLGQNIVGSVAASGSALPVFTIGDLGRVWLLAYVREADAPSMHVGEPVEAGVLAYPGRIFTGTLNYVAPAIDATTHRQFVRAEIANSDGALKPEMFANVHIFVGPDVIRPAVPQEAVIFEGPAARVWVALKDRSLGLREIQVGQSEGGMLEVLSGLSRGDSVVTSGSLFIDRAAHSE
jgi:membrane fusion protein, heavy metal efflux system